VVTSFAVILIAKHFAARAVFTAPP
jgi:hypothetical protein